MKLAEPSARNDVELPPAVHWPTVYLMAGLGGGLAAVVIAVAAISALQPAPPAPPATAMAQAQPAPPSRPADAVVRPAAPAPIPGAAANPAEVAEWKPLVPHTPAPVVSIPTPPSRPELGVALAASDPRPPAPAPVFVQPDWPKRPLQRLDLSTERQLLIGLQEQAREIDLDAVQGTVERLMAAKAAEAEKVEMGTDLIARRTDLDGLPVRGASECHLSAEAAKRVDDISKLLRRLTARGRVRTDEIDEEWAADVDDGRIIKFLSDKKDLLKEDNVSVLVQMLQTQGPQTRSQLIKMLASIKGSRSGAALAQRALFDLSPQLRDAAVLALKDRAPDEYRQALLDGFRHPWPPAAEHAAEALVALDDRGAIPNLKAMLDLPDPSAPVRDDKQKWVVPELVKVNHLRNCLLCHAASHSTQDLVRGLVPKPGQELPQAYNESREGEFVRADVTYLRQDFSVMERVAQPAKWPAVQRFDYVVRRRPATDQEIMDMADVGRPDEPTYPQREAIKFALDRLTRSQHEHAALPTGLGP
jgi:hypothetical protein